MSMRNPSTGRCTEASRVRYSDNKAYAYDRWTRRESSSGRTYFFNEMTGQSVWTLPEGHCLRSNQPVKPVSYQIRNEEIPDPRHRKTSACSETVESSSSVDSSAPLSSKEDLAISLADMAKRSKLDLHAPDIMAKVINMLEQPSPSTSLDDQSTVTSLQSPTTSAGAGESKSEGPLLTAAASPVERAEVIALSDFLAKKKYPFSWDENLEFPEPLNSLVNAELAEMRPKLGASAVDTLRLERMQIDKQILLLQEAIIRNETESNKLFVHAEISKQELRLLELKTELRKRQLSGFEN